MYNLLDFFYQPFFTVLGIGLAGIIIYFVYNLIAIKYNEYIMKKYNLDDYYDEE